jgi:hypothetical protein
MEQQTRKIREVLIFGASKTHFIDFVGSFVGDGKNAPPRPGQEFSYLPHHTNTVQRKRESNSVVSQHRQDEVRVREDG